MLAQAEEYQVCPFEMSLDASLYADIIICDYNYVFDPNVYLKRFFSEGEKGDYIFLVDEAHNLVERGRGDVQCCSGQGRNPCGEKISARQRPKAGGGTGKMQPADAGVEAGMREICGLRKYRSVCVFPDAADVAAGYFSAVEGGDARAQGDHGVLSESAAFHEYV